jgi:hypothetical protein
LSPACAVRDLICATISVVLAQEASAKTTQTIAAHPKGDESMESHHFVVNMSVYPGDELKTLNSTGIIGMHNSKWLNGTWSILSLPITDQCDVPSCQSDELINTVVWDVSHPDAVAIKLEHLNAFRMN